MDKVRSQRPLRKFYRNDGRGKADDPGRLAIFPNLPFAFSCSSAFTSLPRADASEVMLDCLHTMTVATLVYPVPGAIAASVDKAKNVFRTSAVLPKAS